ncbi:unnamed protein product [Paramecium octaurelia]|uniref:Uncharacterized protein n=1 Tax=Paramecium octaurelia TaxID=43137 RepID=A0A8S1T262_PAROT|nr:unnamed protein product [Paramecium octaurelia]
MISTNKILYLFNQINYLGSAIQFKENQQCIQAQSKLSAKFYPANSIIKVLFINTEITNNNCNYVYFYSQCNYQGTNYQIQQGNQLDRSNKISFEIKSIKICPNVIVKLRGPTYFGGNDQVFSSSQISLQSYQFPSYRAPS